jgi:signal transduction histidine kinase
VAACNNDGIWNMNGQKLQLVVQPYVWQTWWFKVAAACLLAGGVAWGVRRRERWKARLRFERLEREHAVEHERSRIAKDIHDDLGANLTQIAFLGELAHQDRAEPEKAAERVGTISTTARQAIKSLDEIVWAVNPRNDTLAHLLDYAGQFAVDYLRVAGIRCRLDFPEQIPVRELSTDLRHNLFLVVKESLHNIFKHAEATEVRLRVVTGERALEIFIEDNGRGFASAPDNALSDGLRNMQQRMADIGGTFSVESRPGNGTKIGLRQPWPENK